MNELNIYARYNYKRLIRKANLYFNKKFHWLFPQTVFAPLDGKYSIAFRKYSIHISYWDEESQQCKEEKNSLKTFLSNNVYDMKIVLEYDKKCDITEMLEKNNTLL